MPFCPKCRAEYREGFTRCNDCLVELVADLPEEQPVEDLRIVRLAVFQTTAEASMIRELLEENSIVCMMRGQNDPVGATSGAAPIGLFVEEESLQQAQELYAAFFAGKPEMGSSESEDTESDVSDDAEASGSEE